MFIDHFAVKSSSASDERNVPAFAQAFRSSGDSYICGGPQFYEHFVHLGLKTTTQNQNFLFATTLETPH